MIVNNINSLREWCLSAFTYCKKTGKLYCNKKGTERGWETDQGYREVNAMGQKKYKTHRIIWLMEYGELPDTLDHIDQDRLNNRLDNLRVVSRAENQKNMKLTKTNQSGFNGVYWNKTCKKWAVQVNVNGKPKSYGLFEDKTTAIALRMHLNSVLGYSEKHGSPT